MKRCRAYGDLVLSPAERKGMEAYYRAIERRDWAARRGTYQEWRLTEARVRELESLKSNPVEHTHDDKPLVCAAEWTQFLSNKPPQAGRVKR